MLRLIVVALLSPLLSLFKLATSSDMPAVSRKAALLLIQSVIVLSVPFPSTELYKGRLLGSSFGVLGIDLSYDYVIVGGGNAGLNIAARLAEHAPVVVIEARGFYEMRTIPIF